jgi:hypothetical protein
MVAVERSRLHRHNSRPARLVLEAIGALEDRRRIRRAPWRCVHPGRARQGTSAHPRGCRCSCGGAGARLRSRRLVERVKISGGREAPSELDRSLLLKASPSSMAGLSHLQRGQTSQPLEQAAPRSVTRINPSTSPARLRGSKVGSMFRSVRGSRVS